MEGSPAQPSKMSVEFALEAVGAQYAGSQEASLQSWGRYHRARHRHPQQLRNGTPKWEYP